MANIFAIFSFIIVVSLSLSSQPTWTRDFNIDSGQFKAVNFEFFLANSTSAVINPTNSTLVSLHFNYTGFTVTPRIIFGLVSYGVLPLATYTNTLIGFQTVLVSINQTNCTVRVTAYGVKLISVHYQYFAVQGYTDLYYMQIYNLPAFNSSSPINNISAGSVRSQTMILTNPQNYITDANYSSSEMVLQVFPLYFSYTAQLQIISFQISTVIVSTSSFSLTITTNNNCSISTMGISVLYLNKTKIYQYTYSQFIDLTITTQFGNTLAVNVTSTTMTDIPNQYQFRNSAAGVYEVYLPMSPALSPTVWYFTASSSTTSIITGISLQQRTRVCSGNTTLYFVQDGLCYDSCPSYGYNINKTYNFCKKCHYTCQNCSLPSISNACTLCDYTYFRVLINSSCVCDHYYFQNTSQILCASCYYTCYSCSDTTNNSCLSCDSAINRVLFNSTCLCKTGFYDNVTCMSCQNYCIQCQYYSSNNTVQCLSCGNSSLQHISADSLSCECNSYFYRDNITCSTCPKGCSICTNGSFCTSCDTANSWISSNSTSGACICKDLYYQSTNGSLTTCLLCSLTGCKVCNLNNSNLICTSCDLSNNFIPVNGSCSCIANYTLNVSVCSLIFVNPVCGNGIFQTGEQCDDGNTFNLDGCSSICQIQPDHFCDNSGTVTNLSLCYYSKSVQFNIKQIFKQPLQNKVILTIEITAPNCNQTYLKQYLEQTSSLQLLSNTRLLTQSSYDITSKTITYDSVSSILTINFQYNQSIDLNKKLVQFIPSLTADQQVKKYFYASPVASVSLFSPTNKLLTTFSTPEQIYQVTILQKTFLAVIILWWVLLFVGICFNQTAIAIQSMLVLQIAYESLLQSKFINDGWIGLILYGKYTYGININYKPLDTFDRLQALSLNAVLFNTLNITTGLLFLVVILILAVFCYETVKVKVQSSYVVNQTEAKIQANEQDNSNQRDNQQFYKIKKGVIVLLFEIGFALSFLTIKIVVITSFFITTQVIVDILIVSLIMGACYCILWYFYIHYYNSEFLQELSFRKMINNINDEDQQISKLQKIINLFVKYYYIVIFAMLIIFGVVNGSVFSGVAFYISMLTICLTFIAFTLVVGVYYRNLNGIRAMINTLMLSAIMVLYLLQSLNTNNPGQSISQPIIGISLLFVCMLFNFGVIVRVQYRKNKKRQRPIKEKKKTNKIVNTNIKYARDETEQPQMNKDKIQIQYREFVEPAQNQIDKSQEGFIKEQKFQSIQSRSIRSAPISETQKKLRAQEYNGDNQLTKQKYEGSREQKIELGKPEIKRKIFESQVEDKKQYDEYSQVQRIEMINLNNFQQILEVQQKQVGKQSIPLQQVKVEQFDKEKRQNNEIQDLSY